MTDYVHGYAPRESARLEDQAAGLETIIHDDVTFPPGSRVLEVGCGVGAQTVVLARNSPAAEIIAMDVSAPSVAEAAARIAREGLGNVRVLQADLLDAPFERAAFDHAFVCFVLEHLADPLQALFAIRRLVRSGGSVTVVEGDHGSVILHPESPAARDAIAALVWLQQAGGGDPCIGRKLHPLLTQAGFEAVVVTPRLIHVDGSRPDLAESFTRRTFTAMIEGVRDAAVASGRIGPERFDDGIRGLDRAAEADGTFSYTFFRARCRTP